MVATHTAATQDPSLTMLSTLRRLASEDTSDAAIQAAIDAAARAQAASPRSTSPRRLSMLEIQASDAYRDARAERDKRRAAADFLGGNVAAVAVRSEANTLRKQFATATANAAAATMRAAPMPIALRPTQIAAAERSKWTVPGGFTHPVPKGSPAGGNKPSASRLDELSLPFKDPFERAIEAAAAEKVALEADGRPGFFGHPSPTPLGKTGGCFGYADVCGERDEALEREFARSVHLPAGVSAALEVRCLKMECPFSTSYCDNSRSCKSVGKAAPR